MNFRKLLLTCALAPASLSAFAGTLPAGTIVSGGLNWLRPDATLRYPEEGDAFCAANTTGGRGGWRMPTRMEVVNLYYEYGAGGLKMLGWPVDWMWALTTYLNGRQVVNMADGTWSYGNDIPHPIACVRSAPAQTAATVVNGALTWARPTSLPRPWLNAVAWCPTATINGMTGWRMPTQPELSAFWAAKGAAYLASAGWTSGTVWTSTPFNSNAWLMVAMGDGSLTYGTDQDADRAAVACVRDTPALPPATLTNAGLTFTKPATLLMPWTFADTTCSGAVIGGQTGWRLGSTAELTALYNANGASGLMAAGWPMSSIWAYSIYGGGYQVV